jgi:CRP-like cAMP-binding protein
MVLPLPAPALHLAPDPATVCFLPSPTPGILEEDLVRSSMADSPSLARSKRISISPVFAGAERAASISGSSLTSPLRRGKLGESSALRRGTTKLRHHMGSKGFGDGKSGKGGSSSSKGKLFPVKERRVSIDCGPVDWPTASDMGTMAPPIHQEPDYHTLIDEIRSLEICFTEQVLPKESDELSPTTASGGSSMNPPPGVVRKLSSQAVLELPNFSSPEKKGGKKVEETVTRVITVPRHASGASGAKSASGSAPTTLLVHTQKVRIPDAAELNELPKELADHIGEAAGETLRRLWIPILALRQKKIARSKLRTERQALAASITPDFISQLSLFRSWPSEVLPAVVQALKLHCFEPKEMIVYEREPASAMLFLSNGTVHSVARHRTKSSYRDPLGTTTQTIHQTHCFGEMNLLTDEPWSFGLRCVTRVDMWMLTKKDFQRLIKLVPMHVMGNVIRTAFHRRNNAMRKHFPMTPELLKQNPLFEHVSHDFAAEIVDRLEPHAAPKDYLLCGEGEPESPMFVVMHGQVGQFRKTGDDLILVGTLGPGSIVGASALAHGASIDATYKTLTDSDLYILSRTTFNAIAKGAGNDLDLMLEAARAQRHIEISTNQSKYLEVVQRIPMLKDILPSYFVKDFLPLLQPKSYRPLSSVCSTSNFCDRLIILVKGKIKLHDGTELKPNECIGWTCCVPHRWGQGALTGNVTAEVLEVPCQDYMDFLSVKGYLNTIIRQTKMILFPKAFPKQQVDTLLAQVGPHPISYPISKSRIVNHNEQGFCTVHMHLLEEFQREEQDKAIKKLADTPPPYRQLSSGVWVPRALNVRGFLA